MRQLMNGSVFLLIVLLVNLLAGCGGKSEEGNGVAETARKINRSSRSATADPRDQVGQQLAGGPDKTGNGPIEKPSPPFQVATPKSPNAFLDGNDVSQRDPLVLRSAARSFGRRGQWQVARQLMHLAIKRSDDGYYDMACYSCRCNRVDETIYWLQRAALEEGVDSDWASKDSDLVAVRREARWPRLHRFLTDCNQYWSQGGITDTVLVLPNNYSKQQATPLVVALHGLGSNPKNFVSDLQDFANEHRVAFLGVSGTLARGPKKFVWACKPADDAARVERAIASVTNRMTIDRKQVILMGFSQGAQVSAELLARHPDKYAGAIVLSAGADKNRLNQVSPSSLLKKRAVVIVCGDGEHPTTIRFTDEDGAWYRRSGAQVIFKKYPGMNVHSFPPDFLVRLPEWIRFIVGAVK